jgi:type IV pilus assembly protein PilY1
MGYSYGAPLVVKTAKYGWVVALTSGYNNSDGYGYLYLVNPATGALLQKIKTPNPSNGLTQASAYVQDYTDYTADSIYVGDLEGQLWRFNLTGTPSSYPAPTQIAALTDSLGNPQPVTTAPLIEIHPTTRKRYVLVGTGQLLSSNDVGSTAMQTFYAIIDGTAGAFNTDATPITRSDLTPVTNVTASTPIPASSMGWYLDLGTSWRMVTNPVAYNGIVVFAALEASTNVCSPSGQSDLYALNYASGLSVLTSSTGTPAVNVPYSNAVTNIAIVNTNSNTTNSSTEIVVGDNKENLSSPPANLYSTLATRILNWREIPTTQ